MKYVKLKLTPVISFIKRDFPFKELKEYPWRGVYKELVQHYNRELLKIEYENVSIGAMYLSYEREIPELIFFEIARDYRKRGLGRNSLRLLFNLLKKRGYSEIFIQTGRPYIYERMGFKFRAVEKRGIIIDLDNFNADKIEERAPLSLIFSDEYLIHDIPEHPDKNLRISLTIEKLREEGLLNYLNIITPRIAKIEDLLLVHTKRHIENVEAISKMHKRAGPSTPAIPESYRCALLSYGGAIFAGELVEKYKKIFVLSRPPGHHAEREKAKGFCFFNNMAGLALKLFKSGYRPMIIDWDIHHGDGTQKLLYDKPIMFVSIHQKHLYPFSGYPEERGEGEGKGYNINIFVPPLTEDEEYLSIFKEVFGIAEQYKPDILLISAGQDGLKEDLLSGTQLTPRCYYEMAKIVNTISEAYCNGRLILLLEGGYALEKVAEANLNIIKGILDSSR